MTAVGSQEVVQVAREFNEAFGDGDWERVRAMLTSDAVLDEVPTQRHVEGADAIVELSRGWKQAFSDARATVTNVLASDDTAVLELTYEGTHDGTLESPQGAIPPSGKKATVRAVQILRVTDGKVNEFRNYFDLLTLLGQIASK
jgi:steroid delta-isomerase-like uncharacterized protein